MIPLMNGAGILSALFILCAVWMEKAEMNFW